MRHRVGYLNFQKTYMGVTVEHASDSVHFSERLLVKSSHLVFKGGMRGLTGLHAARSLKPNLVMINCAAEQCNRQRPIYFHPQPPHRKTLIMISKGRMSQVCPKFDGGVLSALLMTTPASCQPTQNDMPSNAPT